MSKESFGTLCKRVCRENGWQLAPNGLRLSLPASRSQLVELELFAHAGHDMVRLFSTIGPADGLEDDMLKDALAANATLAHGALAIRSGQLVMTDTLIVADADESELTAAVRFLGERGDFFERTLFGGDRY